jgi:hypothetical protein
LRRQLDHANERDRENRRIIAVLTSRIPELEAPSEPREAHMTLAEGEDRGARVPPEPQEPAERRSWLYRFFFGPS